VSQSSITTLAESQVSTSPHDVVIVELIKPDGMPAIVKVTWPEMPTVIDPMNFGDAASIVVKLFSTAHIELARIKSRRHR
jgi:hypothetical protein